MATKTATKPSNTSGRSPKKSSAPAKSTSTRSNELRGALFANKKKERDSQPGYTGTCEVLGNAYYISGWKQTAEKGELKGQAYFSLAFNAKDKDNGPQKDGDDDLRGVLFKNGRKEKDTQPDYTGRATIGNVQYYVSAWLQEVQNGDNKGDKYFSLAFRDAAEAKKASEPEPTPAATDIQDDDIPF